MVAFTLALPIIIDLVYHLFSGHSHCACARCKDKPGRGGRIGRTIWAPWAPLMVHSRVERNFRVVDCGTPRTCENVKKCSTISTCYCWDRWKIKQGVFWFSRQRSTFLPEIVENEYQWSTFTTRKWTSFSMYCGKPIKPSLPLGDALCSGLPEN